MIERLDGDEAVVDLRVQGRLGLLKQRCQVDFNHHQGDQAVLVWVERADGFAGFLVFDVPAGFCRANTVGYFWRGVEGVLNEGIQIQPERSNGWVDIFCDLVEVRCGG